MQMSIQSCEFGEQREAREKIYFASKMQNKFCNANLNQFGNNSICY